MKRELLTLSKIAFRNVRLQKRRSAFILVILVLGCAGLMVVAGFFEGVLLNLREQFIHGATGHLMISKAGYYDHGVANPFEFLLASQREITDQCLRRPEVSVVVPRLQFEGLLATEDKASSVGIIGVDPDAERKMGLYGKEGLKTSAMEIVEGTDLSAEDPDGIIVGRGVAKLLKLKISDSVSLLASGQAGSLDGASYHVRGIFQTPIREFDNQFIKVNLGSAQAVSHAENGVTSLLVILHRTESTAIVQSDLAKSLDGSGYEVFSWEQRGEFYRNGRDLLKQIYFILQLIFSCLIFLSIASSINMAFFERIREFGTMMALGNPRNLILFLVTMETLILGFIGLVLGLGLAILGGMLLSNLGLQMPPLPGSTSGYGVKIILTPLIVFKVGAIGMCAALLSSFFVSLRAYSLKIVDALGYT